MYTKVARTARKADLGHGCKAGEPVVAATIHINAKTFDMLVNVALARALNNVAKASHGRKVLKRDLSQSVASVIEELIECHREELEVEAHMVKGGPRRR